VAALAMVTLNPAKQLRIDNRVGSIEVGKDADLVLFDGHPLAIQSVVQKTWIDGDLYFDLDADRERQAFIDDLKTRMGAKESAEDGKESGGNGGREIFWADDHYSCREDH
jgi:cytosine/adenosine deaminase-related metal-dependent hydrolase